MASRCLRQLLPHGADNYLKRLWRTVPFNLNLLRTGNWSNHRLPVTGELPQSKNVGTCPAWARVCELAPCRAPRKEQEALSSLPKIHACRKLERNLCDKRKRTSVASKHRKWVVELGVAGSGVGLKTCTG